MRPLSLKHAVLSLKTWASCPVVIPYVPYPSWVSSGGCSSRENNSHQGCQVETPGIPIVINCAHVGADMSKLIHAEDDPSFLGGLCTVLRNALPDVVSSISCLRRSASTSATRYRPLIFFPLAATCFLQSSQYHFTTTNVSN